MKTNITKDLFCEICLLQFDKNYVYDVHMSLVHMKNNYSTDSPQSKIDETVVQKKIKALDKGVIFENIQRSTTIETMNKNTNVIHEEKKPHTCPNCDYSSARKTSLKNHIDVVHEGKKPHKCSICDRSFAQTNTLKRHVSAVHEGKI